MIHFKTRAKEIRKKRKERKHHKSLFLKVESNHKLQLQLPKILYNDTYLSNPHLTHTLSFSFSLCLSSTQPNFSQVIKALKDQKFSM